MSFVFHDRGGLDFHVIHSTLTKVLRGESWIFWQFSEKSDLFNLVGFEVIIIEYIYSSNCAGRWRVKNQQYSNQNLTTRTFYFALVLLTGLTVLVKRFKVFFPSSESCLLLFGGGCVLQHVDLGIAKWIYSPRLPSLVGVRFLENTPFNDSRVFSCGAWSYPLLAFLRRFGSLFSSSHRRYLTSKKKSVLFTSWAFRRHKRIW